MKLIYILILILSCSICKSQNKTTVLFEFDKFHLSPIALKSLDSVVTFVKTSSRKVELSLSGHTDAVGSNDYNVQLSIKRINAVKDYLTSHGIPHQNITEQNALGETQPVSDNESETGRAINRRVEIILNRENAENISLKEKIADTTTVIGSTIVLKNINFYGGMHQLLPESEPQLKELLDAMLAYPKLVIRIEGHICCQEGPQDGMDIETNVRNLSSARAKAIMDYLIEKGIDKNRVSYKGFAHTNPLFPYPEQNEEEQKLNRRVEIKILSK